MTSPIHTSVRRPAFQHALPMVALLLLFVSFVPESHAQPGAIFGYVVELLPDSTLVPIPDVEVQLSQGSTNLAVDLTDVDGKFEFLDLALGPYSLSLLNLPPHLIVIDPPGGIHLVNLTPTNQNAKVGFRASAPGGMISGPGGGPDLPDIDQTHAACPAASPHPDLPPGQFLAPLCIEYEGPLPGVPITSVGVEVVYDGAVMAYQGLDMEDTASENMQATLLPCIAPGGSLVCLRLLMEGSGPDALIINAPTDLLVKLIFERQQSGLGPLTPVWNRFYDAYGNNAFTAMNDPGFVTVTFGADREHGAARKSAPASDGQPALLPNYPNPFNPTTTIGFSLPADGPVTVAAYNMLGQRVALLAEGFRVAGTHQVQFEAADLPSGLYLYSIKTPGFTATRQMLLLK